MATIDSAATKTTRRGRSSRSRQGDGRRPRTPGDDGDSCTVLTPRSDAMLRSG